jgi:type IV/VI secretion system ImpK/VasF family protein
MNEADKLRYEIHGRFCQPFAEFMTKVVVAAEQKKGSASGLASQFEIEISRIRRTALEAKTSMAEVDSALFAVCAWADETIMNAEWAGVSEVWPQLLLQQTFFQTNLAGDLFFEKMDALATQSSLAYDVYALCLANGFKGKYVLNLAIDEWEMRKQEAINQSLAVAGLLNSRDQTFVSINALEKDSNFRTNQLRAALIVVVSLLGISLIALLFETVLNHRVTQVLESWR